MQTSFSELEYAAKKKLTRRDRFLAEIEAVTPWAAQEAEIAPFYPKGEGRGRPPIGLHRMLRMYIAQQCFGLSDEGIEDALYDSQAIRRFVGIDLARESAPDATTLLKFRRLLETNEWTTDGTRIENYPKLHRENLTKKHQSTEQWLKPMVRVMKNMRSKLVADGTLDPGAAPSYYIEGLLYNIPNEKFGTSYGDCFVNGFN